MEARDHFKNGASSKSQMSRENILNMKSQVVNGSNGNFRMEADTISKNGRSSKSLMNRKNMIINMLNRKFLLALFIAVLTASYAQAQAKYKFGPQVGVNFTNKKFTYVASGVSESVSTKMKSGFQVGGIVEIDEGKKFVMQAGLLISSQRCVFEKNNLEEVGYLKDATLSVTYLRLSDNIVFKKDLGSMTFLASGGVYVGVAVGGKVEEEKIEFGKEKLMPRFDIGLNLGPGLQFGNLQATLEYSIGYWFNEANSVAQFTLNNGFSLNLKYLFGN